jgi:hypothetical protein
MNRDFGPSGIFDFAQRRSLELRGVLWYYCRLSSEDYRVCNPDESGHALPIS